MFSNEPVQNVFMTKYYSAKDLTPDPSPVERGALGTKKAPLFAGEGVWGEVIPKEYLVISFFLDSLDNH